MKEKKAAPLFFLAAMTWFGYHCGAGFASGAQVRIYAAQYGRIGIVVPIIAWVACTIFMYIVCEYGRLIKAKSYRDVGATIYYDKSPALSRIIILLWDILIFMSSITAVGSCVAGCGALFEQLFGLPYWIGCAGFIIVMVLILCFGQNILERLGKLGTALVIVFFVVCGVGLAYNFGHMTEVMATDLGASTVEMTPMTLFTQGMTYGIVQIGSFQALCVMSGKFTSRSDTIKFSLMGFLINCGAMLISFFSLMAYYTDIINDSLPTLGIIQNFSGPLYIILIIAYNFVLIMAYITTAGAMIAGGQARYVPLLSKKINSELACRVIVTLVFIGSATALSTLGLDGILTTVNGINASARLPIWFIPLLILGPIAIHRVSKQQKLEQSK